MAIRLTAEAAKRLQLRLHVSPYLQAREIIVKALRPIWGRLEPKQRQKLIEMLEEDR